MRTLDLCFCFFFWAGGGGGGSRLHSFSTVVNNTKNHGDCFLFPEFFLTIDLQNTQNLHWKHIYQNLPPKANKLELGGLGKQWAYLKNTFTIFVQSYFSPQHEMM